MKKLLAIVVLGFILTTPNLSYACGSIATLSSICSESDIDEMLEYYRNNMFSKYTLPKGMTKAEAIKILNTAKKKKKAEKKRRCTYFSGNANNSWSAYKMYRECMKE